MRVLWCALSILVGLSGCALGFGRIPHVSTPAGPGRAREVEVVGRGPGFILVREVAGQALGEGFNLPFGLSGGVMPSLSVLFPQGTASSPNQGGAGSGWTAHGDLFVPIYRLSKSGPNLGVTLQYQYSSLELDYVGGFGLGARHHGVLGFLGADFGPLGLELGGGGLFAGRLGVGGRGNVLGDSSFTLGSAASGGFRAATRATLFLSGGGGLQMKTALRLEAGYQRMATVGSPPPGVPPALGAFNVGGELVITFF